MPSPQRTTLVVGRPIRVPSLRTVDGRPAQPTDGQVALLHRFYFSRLRALFYEHREAHGDGYERAELVYHPPVDDMDEGETVCVIPWDLMIMPDVVIDPMVDDDCGTIHALYDAMSEGGKTPYSKYLLDQPVDYLPSFWSQVSERVV